MIEYGVSDIGFVRKRLDVITEELNTTLRNSFGENFNLSTESVAGQLAGINAEAWSLLWELAEQAYNSLNPSVATGAALSNLVQLNGITRFEAKSTRAALKIVSSITQLTILEGALVSTESGIQFKTIHHFDSINSANSIVLAETLEVGPLTVLANTINKIETPIIGWESVTNEQDAIPGRYEETDMELRVRREKSVSRNSQSLLDSIIAAIQDVPLLVQSLILENATDVTDSITSLPPHSFEVIADGGSDEDIANTIWLHKPAGIESYGHSDQSVSVVISDSQAITHIIKFSRPKFIPIYILLHIVIIEGEFPSTGNADIKQEIIDYAEKEWCINDDILFTRLYTPINKIPGHTIFSLCIGKDSPPTQTSNISIGVREMSEFSIDNIEIVNHHA